MNQSDDRQTPDVYLLETVSGDQRGAYRPVRLRTARGEVATRYYRSPGARGAVIYVGTKGWTTPAQGLYPELGRSLARAGLAGLQVRLRRPSRLDEAVHDVLAGLDFLAQVGINHVGIVGHSFAGPVTIHAAAARPQVRTVVTLATSSDEIQPVSTLSPRCSLLLIHGTADDVVPYHASLQVYEMAGPPKSLVLQDGAVHTLAEAADEVYQRVDDWLRTRLAARQQVPPALWDAPDTIVRERPMGG